MDVNPAHPRLNRGRVAPLPPHLLLPHPDGLARDERRRRRSPGRQPLRVSARAQPALRRHLVPRQLLRAVSRHDPHLLASVPLRPHARQVNTTTTVLCRRRGQRHAEDIGPQSRRHARHHHGRLLVVLDAVLHHQHHRRLLHDVHPSRRIQRLHVARILQQHTQPDHLQYFQSGIPRRLQACVGADLLPHAAPDRPLLPA